jgi:hypothetical protein
LPLRDDAIAEANPVLLDGEGWIIHEIRLRRMLFRIQRRFDQFPRDHVCVG